MFYKVFGDLDFTVLRWQGVAQLAGVGSGETEPPATYEPPPCHLIVCRGGRGNKTTTSEPPGLAVPAKPAEPAMSALPAEPAQPAKPALPALPALPTLPAHSIEPS